MKGVVTTIFKKQCLKHLRLFRELRNIHENSIVCSFTPGNQHTYEITTSVHEVIMCLNLYPVDLKQIAFASDTKKLDQFKTKQKNK